MGCISRYSVTLDEGVVEEARSYLEVGQKLSPVINQILKEWVKLKREAD